MNKGSGNIINETNYKFYNPCETASILEKKSLKRKASIENVKEKKGGEKKELTGFIRVVSKPL